MSRNKGTIRSKQRAVDSLPARLAARSTTKGSKTADRKYALPRTKNMVKRQRLNPGLKTSVHVSARDWGAVRLKAVVVFFALLWLCLWTRAGFVQLVNGPELGALASRQHSTTEYVVGERGQIVDCNGRLLAKSVAVKSVFADPRKIGDKAVTARALASILDLKPGAVKKLLSEKGAHVWIARQIDDAKGAKVADLKLQGVYITREYARQYPNKQLAGRLLGFVGLDDQGLEGLEAAFDELLAGKKANFSVERDAAGRKMYFDAFGKEVEIRGKDLRLTLDSNMQFMAEEALAKAVKEHKGKWGGCMVVRVEDGHIMAWAEYPAFNPNAYRNYKPTQWLNRMVMVPIEPGSSIKPLLVAAALQEGKIEPDTIFYCEKGRWKVDRKVIKDTSKHDWLPVNRIIQHSSNIGVAKIAITLGARKYYSYLSRLGFGSRTGLPLAGERSGILRSPDTWDKFELATAGFGQGFSVTLPQLARAYLCLANDGVLKPLHLVMDPYDVDLPEMQVFEPSVTRSVMEMLRQVVQEGTGKRGGIPGLVVAGKTSTAQKASPAGGYGKKVVASFVGFVPGDRPEYLILVSVDEPEPQHYGGVVAAPAFKEVALRTMSYLGRLPEKPVAVAADTSKAKPLYCSRAELRAKVSKDCIVAADKVPDVRGYTIRKAMEVFAGKGVVPSLRGSGQVVAKQTPAPGEPWPAAAKQYILWLQDNAERS